MSTDKLFDPLRRKEVAATAEERVRQWFISILLNDCAVPAHLMMSEAEISLGNVHLRCDIVCYANTTNTEGNRMLHPKMIVECKKPDVAITQKVCDQACRYNTVLRVPYLLLTNGRQMVTVEVNFTNGTLRQLREPNYYVKKS